MIWILTEDRYGKEFFKKLVNRMKELSMIQKSKQIKIKWFPGKCRPKLSRILLALTVKSNQFQKCIIFADAEGKEIETAKTLIQKHIPRSLQKSVHCIIFDYCIEEWICEGMNIKWRGQHPVECLDNYLQRTKQVEYEKYMLPSFAEIIDIHTLLKNNQKFYQFYELIK